MYVKPPHTAGLHICICSDPYLFRLQTPLLIAKRPLFSVILSLDPYASRTSFTLTFKTLKQSINLPLSFSDDVLHIIIDPLHMGAALLSPTWSQVPASYIISNDFPYLTA